MNRSMVRKLRMSILIFFGVFVVLSSCSHFDELQKNGEESTVSESSHNAGQNCMRCHNDNNNEASEKWWNIAGTVYDEDDQVAGASGSIELWTESDRKGTLLYKVQVDQSGNFYTEKIVDFKGGFYPVFVSNDGKDVEAMPSKVNTGACGSCHGVSTPRIEID